jgi:hypothetical protein
MLAGAGMRGMLLGCGGVVLAACGGSAVPDAATGATLLPPDLDRPTPAQCAALRPARWLPAQGAPADHAALRVVAIQYKQVADYAASYLTFRTKMRCLVEDQVVPLLRADRTTLVVFNEDIGLLTLATGSRGAAVRLEADTPLRAPLGDSAPAALLAALVELNAAYAPQIAAYQLRYGPIDPRKQVFVGATDTFVRAFVRTFSDIARDYGIYVVASNSMAQYRASADPADIALFKDPDLAQVDEVYVATSARVANSTFLWGPQTAHADAPAGEKNLLFRNDKVPLTAFELDDLALDQGPVSGPAAIANAAGWPLAAFRLGFATSLPAFAWGYAYGAAPPAGLDPCADARVSYMLCMNAQGVDVLVQAEANDGRWAANVPGSWQPLQWMGSAWRAVNDPAVGFRYAINPMMTGNLLDLPFDGQSAILARGSGASAHYIGNLVFDPSTDQPQYRAYVGDQPGFLALAPWVGAGATRAELIATGAKLAPGSGDALENDYLETAVWADLRR